MASFSKKTARRLPSVSTASLPDIIFTLLFFFMVAANVKDNVVKVKQVPPKVVETKKLTKKDQPRNIYIGFSSREEGLDPIIQLDNKLLAYEDVDAVRDFVFQSIMETSASKQNDLLFNLKADQDVPMHIILKVKEEMRKGAAMANVDFLRLNYYSQTQEYSFN